MKCFDWNHHLDGGFYAAGVAIAIAPDIETARQLLRVAFVEERHRRYDWSRISEQDRPKYKSCIEAAADDFVKSLLNQDPVIRELPYALARETVD